MDAMPISILRRVAMNDVVALQFTVEAATSA
jgi:hypothetical protein